MTSTLSSPRSRPNAYYLVVGLVFLTLVISAALVGSMVGYQRGYIHVVGQEGEVVAKVYDISDLLVPAVVNPATLPPDLDSVTEIITTSLEPESWDDEGGRGTISGTPDNRSLIINQTEEMHRRIAKLLQEIRHHLAPQKDRPASEQ